MKKRTEASKAMPQLINMNFADKSVSYETFVNDLSARVLNIMKNDSADPEYVSQRTAYKMFGRSNVDRWRRSGKIKVCKRPGKVEYRTADLRMLQRTEQDYL